MNKNWRQISIDDERKVPSFENYEQFQDLLKTVSPMSPSKDLFPRPDQKAPITSYGIIPVYDTGDSFEYYCTQRRCTIEFGELVKCGPRQKNLFEYMSCMTTKERELLSTQPHDKLWNDLLLEQTTLFQKVFKITNSTYESYDHIMLDLINLTTSNTNEPQWEFTKGRSTLGERTHLQTALRELFEEGKLRFEQIILMWPDVVHDIYRGTDGQLYETVYFIVKSEIRYEPDLIYLDTNCIGEWCLSLDMSNYGWIPLPKQGNQHRGQTPLGERLEKLLFSVHKLIT